MKKYIIVPFCSDLNRGDQALTWETKKLAEECGFIGEYYLIAEKNEPINQSKKRGIKIINPILEHPSRFDGKKNNIDYDMFLKIKWGIISLFDLIRSLMLILPVFKNMPHIFLNTRKKDVFRIFESADAVFMKGGGCVHSYGGITSFYHMYYILFNILLAQSMNKDVYIMPNSFGPFDGICVKWLVKKTLKKCRLIYSRESISTGMLEKHFNINVETMPDLAFFLKSEKYNLPEALNLDSVTTNRKKVAITMRPYRFPNSFAPHKKYEIYKECLRELIIWLYENNFMPVIVEHTLAVLEHENDLQCIKDVIKNIPKEKYILVSDKNMDCENLKWVYGKCDYIIGTRFHSIIFSLAQGIPAIAITYGGNKGKGIMQDIGLEKYAIDIENIDIEKIKQLFVELITDEKNVRQKINKYIEESNIRKMKMIGEMRLHIK